MSVFGPTIPVCDKYRKQIELLREALVVADSAINPPDRDGISLHTWDRRLKEATTIIRAALAKVEEKT